MEIFSSCQDVVKYINPANGDQCWVYGSDIPHGDRLYGAVDLCLKQDDISEESKRKLLIDNTARFNGLEKLKT